MEFFRPFSETRLPFLTASLPGVGGTIKQHNEDFRVEELPLYLPCGQGTHTYFVIEKRGMTTPAAIERIARSLGVKRQDIGYAGLKDAHGVTRQMLSLEHVAPERVSALTFDDLSVLSVDRHGNKLKLGHLAGNRFTVRIRDAARWDVKLAQTVLEVLARRGTPNYFGPQRFGNRGDNALIGRAILLGRFDEAVALLLGRPGPTDAGAPRKARELFDAGDWAAAADAWSRGFPPQARVCRALVKSGDNAQRAWRAVDHGLRRLLLSAAQSELFNGVLAARVDALDRLELGDVAWKHANGACFLVTDTAAEQPRCDALEISPTGPLFGRRMKEAEHEVAARETTALNASGISPDRFREAEGRELDGARRPLRVPLGAAEVERGEDSRGQFLMLRFALPPGAYATNVAREVCKTTTHVG